MFAMGERRSAGRAGEKSEDGDSDNENASGHVSN